jgi:hypothetical protein
VGADPVFVATPVTVSVCLVVDELVSLYGAVCGGPFFATSRVSPVLRLARVRPPPPGPDGLPRRGWWALDAADPAVLTTAAVSVDGGAVIEAVGTPIVANGEGPAAIVIGPTGPWTVSGGVEPRARCDAAAIVRVPTGDAEIPGVPWGSSPFVTRAVTAMNAAATPATSAPEIPPPRR